MTERAKAFVEYVFRRKKDDASFRSRMRNAGSGVRETAIWGDLVSFCDIGYEDIRSVYVLIGNSIALEEKEINGTYSFGKLLPLAWGDEKNEKLLDEQKLEQHPATVRLRRLLVCRDVSELCRVLRPYLRLIRTRRPGELDYIKLLDDLIQFQFGDDCRDAVKTRWVKDFYRSIQDRARKPDFEKEEGEGDE